MEPILSDCVKISKLEIWPKIEGFDGSFCRRRCRSTWYSPTWGESSDDSRFSSSYIRQATSSISWTCEFLPEIRIKGSWYSSSTHWCTTRSTETFNQAWTDERASVFARVKEVLADTAMLNHPASHLPTSLMVDASDSAVGGVLQQLSDGVWKPIAFFSHSLHTSLYGTSDTYSKYVLSPCIRITSLWHNALRSKPDWHSPREIRHLDYISQFTSDIRHVIGIENPVADALSRLHVDALHTSSLVNFHQLAVDLEDNDEWPEVQYSHSLTFKCVPLPTNNGHIWCDTSTGNERPFVPKKHRRTDLNAILVCHTLASSLHGSWLDQALYGLTCTVQNKWWCCGGCGSTYPNISMAHLTPMSSITKTNCLILQYELSQ